MNPEFEKIVNLFNLLDGKMLSYANLKKKDSNLAKELRDSVSNYLRSEAAEEWHREYIEMRASATEMLTQKIVDAATERLSALGGG